MGKRDSIILDALAETGRMDVAELAGRVGVSQVTLRKDLDALQARGLVQRVHGSAMLANPNDVSGRLAYHYEEKLLIARVAARLVPDGSTIMVESGTRSSALNAEATMFSAMAPL